MRRFAICLASFAALATAACAHAQGTAPPARPLLFADEFDAPALDRAKWNVEGPDFWVNNEQQAYVDDPGVIAIVSDLPGAKGGALMLRPAFAPGADPKAERKAPFLSGRIDSRGKFDFTHGRAEARIRLPSETGVWPAFWLLGNGQWPATGEIDIMEFVGEKDWIGVALHGPGYSGETPLVNKFYFPAGFDATQWHTYAVEWSADAILFYVNDWLVYRATRPMVEHYGKWCFDTPKHVILNFAVGGYPVKTNGIRAPYPGVPQATVERIKTGEVAMLVDWVRVWGPERSTP